MKVLIVSVNKEEINMATWPLGAASVAEATAQAGRPVMFLDFMNKADPAAALKAAITDFQPDVIGLSIRNIDNQSMTDTKFFLDEAREMVGEIRALSDAIIVLGGAGYSIFPRQLLSYLGADMGIQGEGEAVFNLLLDALEAGGDSDSVPGLFRAGREPARARSFVRNLDVFPLPDPATALEYAGDDFRFPLQTRRGCPMRCSYCSTAAIEGCGIRSRSPEAVVRWLRKARDAGFTRFFFTDNTFNLPPSYAKKLCREIIAADLGVSWTSIVYPSRVDDELVGLMAEAGAVEVSLGFESGAPAILHAMNKRFTLEEVRRVSEAFGSAGIRRMGFLMLGGPGETLDTAQASIEFADSLNLEMVKLIVGIRIYPETALAHRAVDEGLIDPEDDLLAPRFYVAPQLERRLTEIAEQWISARANWIG